MKPGKGAAFVRSKLKNLLTGNTNERTFRAGEQLNLAEVMRRDGQFTYAEGDNVRRGAGMGSSYVCSALLRGRRAAAVLGKGDAPQLQSQS